MTVEPPKCRTCGVAEWSHTCAGKPAPKAAAKPKKKRDRRAYQRELMRKRRATGKGQKASA